VIHEIRRAAIDRGITRLCHFTPSRNLSHIAADKVGILATVRLEAAERKLFNPTDLERLDGFKTHISCSVEYPNAWYFAQAVLKQPDFFADWVVLAIRRDYLWDDRTLFCPWNAARARGTGVQPDLKGFEAMFANRVRNYSRTAKRLAACPTDEQAEVLVYDCIQLRDIQSVIVKDVDQARKEANRLRYCRVDPTSFAWRVAPVLFDKYRLHDALEAGQRPEEQPWMP
jgi:ssDNA thymidine ADP-ribosyltransferase, DarT